MMKAPVFYRLNRAAVLSDLKKKMVFLTGPRQTGKTWLAKNIMQEYQNPLYLNYDAFKDKKMIAEQSWPSDVDLIVFDEIHKMDQWKNYIKGVFDTRLKHQHILATGSARLQHISRTGDALTGRYFLHTLLPFSVFELKKARPAASFNKLFNKIYMRGGFPEPLLISQTANEAERWRNQSMFSLLREDIPDFKNIQHYKKMETLLYLLREQVGSPVSIYSLSQNLKLDHKTVLKYLSVLEDLFIIFPISAFAKNIARSLMKPKKIYFYDFAFIPPSHKGQRLENLTAVHLLKHCTYLKETKPSKGLSLFYLRTKEKKEVDFLFTKNNQPYLMIEVKAKETAFSKNLIYFYDKYHIPGVQISWSLTRRQRVKNKPIVKENIENFLTSLNT